MTDDRSRAYFSAKLALCCACALSGCAGLNPSTPAARDEPQAAAPKFQLASLGAGLPHSGQWRSELAVADINGDGIPDLVTPASRKGSGRPGIFLGRPDGSWAAWKEASFPPVRYDYGGVATVDLDRDGRLDIVFGMHLKGLAAVLQSSPGGFTDASAGLNDLAAGQAAPTGSQSMLALPAAGSNGEVQVFVAYEPLRNLGVGASIWRYSKGRWERRNVAGAASGSHANAAGPDRVFYLTGTGVTGVDLAAHAPAAYLAGGLAPGSFSHAFAVVHDAGSGNTSGYVSTSRYIGQAWTRRVERISRLAQPAAKTAAPSPDTVVAERTGQSYFSALAAHSGKPWGLAGDIVAAGDDHGNIELYHVRDGGQVEPLGQWPAADWRSGCPASHLQWAKIEPAAPPRLVAMFAGEASAYDLGRGCSNGGGLDVFAVAPTESVSR